MLRQGANTVSRLNISDEQRRDLAQSWRVGTGDVENIILGYHNMGSVIKQQIIARDLDRAQIHHEERDWQRAASTFYAFVFASAWIITRPFMADDEPSSGKEPERFDIAGIVLMFTAIRMFPLLINYIYDKKLKELPGEHAWDIGDFQDNNADRSIAGRLTNAQKREERDINYYRKYMYARLFPAGVYLIHVTRVLMDGKDALSPVMQYNYKLQLAITAGHLFLDYVTSIRYGSASNMPAKEFAERSDKIAAQLCDMVSAIPYLNCMQLKVKLGTQNVSIVEININNVAAYGQRYRQLSNQVRQQLGYNSPLKWEVVSNTRVNTYPFSILVIPSYKDKALVDQQLEQTREHFRSLIVNRNVGRESVVRSVTIHRGPIYNHAPAQAQEVEQPDDAPQNRM